ncbi:MAG: hypothetical protein K0B08_09745 [Bacteroidales bacterium]|nr:hypothetical protein [Bacteroidales bacterium]
MRLFLSLLIIVLVICQLDTFAQEIRDQSGIKLGKIESDGTVRDKSGKKLGTAKGIDPKQAAYLYFFR